eukprot:14434631-Alexandrium_andersonii.AAC.1
MCIRDRTAGEQGGGDRRPSKTGGPGSMVVRARAPRAGQRRSPLLLQPIQIAGAEPPVPDWGG